MTGTVSEILTIRRALVRACLSAERHLASASTKAMCRLYEAELRDIAAAMRVLDLGDAQQTQEERAAIDARLLALRQGEQSHGTRS